MPTQTNRRISFACPSCSETNDVPSAFAGKRGKCSSCKAVVRVPDDAKAFMESLVGPLPTLSKRDMKRLIVETLQEGLAPAEALARLILLGVDSSRAQEVIEDVLAKRRELAVVKTAGGLAVAVVGIVLTALFSGAESVLLFEGLIVAGGLGFAAGLSELLKGRLGSEHWALKRYGVGPVAAEDDEPKAIQDSPAIKIVALTMIPAVTFGLVFFLWAGGTPIESHHLVFAVGGTSLCYMLFLVRWTDAGQRMAKKKLF